MLVVRVKLDIFANRDIAASIESGGAPFFVLTLVIGFGCDIWDEVNGAGRKSPFERQLVSVEPGEVAIFPVEIRAISIRNQQPGLHWEVKGVDCMHTILGGSIWGSDVAVSGFQDRY